MFEIDPSNKGFIDINAKPSPAVLAGILDIPVSMVHQARQDGKLPADTNASYKECIQQYIKHYKTKVNSRATSMGEAKLVQDIRNGIAKEELQWLEVKKEKELLIDVNEMKDLFEPVFHIVKMGLVNLTRKYPETQETIDNILDSWFRLGERISARASGDSISYVQNMLEKEIDLPEATDEANNRFGIDEQL